MDRTRPRIVSKVMSASQVLAALHVPQGQREEGRSEEEEKSVEHGFS
jgi:hypothetical protein